MKITVSQRRGQAEVTAFDGVREISTLDELLEVARFDHVPVVLTEGKNRQGIIEKYHRSDDCFVSADVVYMDCDNDSENPEEWIKPEEIAKRYPELKYYWIASRNNMKGKGGKAPRPKWHIYFPLSREFSDIGEYRELKQKILQLVPEFDAGAKPATQQAFGVEIPQGGFQDGEKFIDEIIDNLESDAGHEEKQEDVIHEGERNDRLYKYAVGVLSNHTTIETARKKFYEKAELCEPPLEKKELEAIWHSALKAETIRLANIAAEVIKTYAEPDNPDFDIDSIEDFYMSRAEEITKDKQRIKNAWKQAKKKFKNAGKKIPLPKMSLKFKDVQAAMREDGITIKTNVITKDTHVDGIPTDSEYTPDGFENLSPTKRRLLAPEMITSYLNPKMKDKNFSFTGDNLNSILMTLARMNDYNPVAEMLEKLEWDNTDRFAELNRILGISDNPLYCSYLRKYFIQAIAMALNDEAKPVANDFVLTFQGAQGIGKTEFFRKTALRSEWFLEGQTYDANDKDKEIAASKAWIVELGELNGTLDKKQARLKAFITAKFDNYRVPYDKRPQSILRRTTFCATVNDDKFLIDTEGGTRRWAVIRLQKNIVNELLSLPENFFYQVYAQAYQLYEQGETFILNDFEKQAQAAENMNFAVPKKGEQELRDCLDWESDISEWREMSALDIINGANLKGITAYQIGKAINAIMSKDTRIKKRKLSQSRVYLLPPLRNTDGKNVYYECVETVEESAQPQTQPQSQEQVQNTQEIMMLCKSFMASFKKNRVKVGFEKFVDSMGADSVTYFLKRPLNYDDNEKIKKAVIDYYHIHYAEIA